MSSHAIQLPLNTSLCLPSFLHILPRYATCLTPLCALFSAFQTHWTIYRCSSNIFLFLAWGLYPVRNPEWVPVIHNTTNLFPRVLSTMGTLVGTMDSISLLIRMSRPPTLPSKLWMSKSSCSSFNYWPIHISSNILHFIHAVLGLTLTLYLRFLQNKPIGGGYINGRRKSRRAQSLIMSICENFVYSITCKSQFSPHTVYQPITRRCRSCFRKPLLHAKVLRQFPWYIV